MHKTNSYKSKIKKKIVKRIEQLYLSKAKTCFISSYRSVLIFLTTSSRSKEIARVLILNNYASLLIKRN